MNDELRAAIKAINACTCGHPAGACVCHRRISDLLELVTPAESPSYAFAIIGPTTPLPDPGPADLYCDIRRLYQAILDTPTYHERVRSTTRGLIAASSLGTDQATALRASVPDDVAAHIVALSKQADH